MSNQPNGRDTIRAVFLRNGFTVKEGQVDLKPYVYAAAEELLRLNAAPLAQTEQQPVATWMGTDWNAQQQLIAHLCKLEPGTDLYAAPIAQAAPHAPCWRPAERRADGGEAFVGEADMIEMKTSELEGKALDWAVAMSEGATNLRFDTVACWWFTLNGRDRVLSSGWSEKQNYYPSTDWRQGGSLIEPNRISLMLRHDGWWIACVYNINDEAEYMQLSDCPLEAAMRCLVASKLGDTVQVPKELLS